MVLFLGKDLVGVRIAFLPNYPLVLSLLKHRDVGTFLNLKIKNPNRENPLNNSIDILVYNLHNVQDTFIYYKRQIVGENLNIL